MGDEWWGEKMVHAMTGEQALKGRRIIQSRGTGEEHWRTDFLGKPAYGGGIRNVPQAFLIEMHAGETILPHFHEVDQFQVFVAGSGGMGRQPAATLAVHFAEHHTGYGPINAGPQGYSYFTLRARSDPGAHYLHRPGYREALKPSRKRHGVSTGNLQRSAHYPEHETSHPRLERSHGRSGLDIQPDRSAGRARP